MSSRTLSNSVLNQGVYTSGASNRFRCSSAANCDVLLSSGNGVLSMFSDIMSPDASDGVRGPLTPFDATTDCLVTGFGNPKHRAALWILPHHRKPGGAPVCRSAYRAISRAII